MAGNQVKGYRDLFVWQRSMDVVERVYRLTATMPNHERYGLSSQLQRSAVSIPSNIAEGHARQSTKEYLYHLSVAIGSLAELETQLTIAVRLGYATSESMASLLSEIEEIGRMLHSLQKSLRNKL
jgi:four helix bundle protein